MKIVPYDRDFRYLVTEREYLVDLLELDGNGKCDCPDFRCARWKAYKAGVRPSRCKHCDEVRRVVGEMLLENAIKVKLAEEKQNHE